MVGNCFVRVPVKEWRNLEIMRSFEERRYKVAMQCW